jgi:hypothetical protein
LIIAATVMPQLKYGSYDGAAPRIALVLTPLNEDNLLLAAQVGATDIVYYNMDSSEWSRSAATSTCALRAKSDINV